MVKIKINENKFRNAVFMFLSNQNYTVLETPNNFYFLKNEDDEYSDINVIKEHMICVVSEDLLNELELFFNYQLHYYIELYVESVLGIDVEVTQTIYNQNRGYLKVRK